MKQIMEELNGDYMDNPSTIPLRVDGRVVTTLPFEPNLNCVDDPSYVNEGCNLGLKRIDDSVPLKRIDEEYRGNLVLMFEDEFFPTQNHGRIISENEAYELCLKKGKNALIKKLDIRPFYGDEE